MNNYDASQVGVPYVRVTNVSIEYLSPLKATIRFVESVAVVNADKSIINYKDLGIKVFELNEDDFQNEITLINPTTGKSINQTTTPENVMMGILAIIRRQQIANEQIHS